MLTAVCNIYLNSETKLGLFKQTFPLVYGISDNWLIYIRGAHRDEAINFIKRTFSNFQQSCTFFSDLDNNNWAKSTKTMLLKSRYHYLYFFIEDHVLLKSIAHFRSILEEAGRHHIDYFQYSFFNIGININSIEFLDPKQTNHFYSFQIDHKNVPTLQKQYPIFFPFSLASISSKHYFLKILEEERKVLIKIPTPFQEIIIRASSYLLHRKFWFNINKLFSKIRIRFVIYPPGTPFNLEKSLVEIDNDLLPVRVGVLRDELFACLDDDNNLPNSSLIKRGLFPHEFVLHHLKDKPILNTHKLLKIGQKKMCRYYPDKPRIGIPSKYIWVAEGDLMISTKNQRIRLRSGTGVWVAANILHVIEAVKNTKYQSYLRD